jgi:single-stranded DNA-binding protein
MNNFGAVVRVISDVEYKEIGGGLTTCRAVHDTSYREDSELFTGLNFWGKKGSAASKLIKKGDQIFVSGNLIARKYNDKQYFDIDVGDFEKVGFSENKGKKAEETENGSDVAEVALDEEIEADIPF